MQDDSGQILRFLGLAFAGADLVFEVDLDGSIAFALGAAERLTGRKDSELIGHDWLALFGADDEDFLTALLRGLAQGDRRGPVRVGLRQADPDLPTRQASLSLFRLPQISQRISCALSLGALAHDAGAHSNAGLVQKDAFAEGFGPLLEEAQRAGLDLRLDLVELAGFEGALAKLDDEAAERKRRQIAALLRSESFAGFGASEVTTDRFALVRTATASEAALTDRLREDAGVEPVTAQLPLGGTAAENARAMRYALDRYIEDGPEATAQGFKAMVERTLRDSTRFKTIVATGAFNLAYQPVVDLKDESLHHFEALVRFDPNVSPAESIRLAEELDMISDFDLAVVQAVLKVLDSPDGRNASVAVNISARSLGSQRFVTELVAVSAGISDLRSRLLLEVTETHQIADFDQVNGALAQLRQLGHKVCLDDFGAGACSLEYLRRLDVDYVKIDGRYVQELVAGSRDAMILKHVVGLCDEMAVATIAEMIENRDAAGICKDVGVTLGQGWVFSKPLPKPVWVPPAPKAPAIRGRRNGKVETWG